MNRDSVPNLTSRPENTFISNKIIIIYYYIFHPSSVEYCQLTLRAQHKLYIGLDTGKFSEKSIINNEVIVGQNCPFLTN